MVALGYRNLENTPSVPWPEPTLNLNLLSNIEGPFPVPVLKGFHLFTLGGSPLVPVKSSSLIR